MKDTTTQENSQLHLFDAGGTCLPATASPPAPDGLDNSSIVLTLDTTEVVERRFLSTSERQYLEQWEHENGQDVGATISLYKSGEVSGACTTPRYAVNRAGYKRILRTFDGKTRRKIMRAVENSPHSFKTFVTFTFRESLSKMDENGNVCEEWAKEQLFRVLNTLKKRYDRYYARTGNPSHIFEYIYVSEKQKNGNVHFHVVTTLAYIPLWTKGRVVGLVDLWGQDKGSVDVKKITNSGRAVGYLLKYMTKDQIPLTGSRYGMSQGLYDTAKPEKISFYGKERRSIFLQVKDDFRHEILTGAGHLGDWGLSLFSHRGNKERKRLRWMFLLKLADAMADTGDYQLQNFLERERARK